MNICFENFIDIKHVVKETLALVALYFGTISLQTKTKLKKSIKTSVFVINCK